MSANKTVLSIKPKAILQLVEKEFKDENVTANVLLPSSDIGSLTLIESAMLVSFIKLLDAKDIFEFGTFLGSTSVLFASNSSPETRLITLDIKDEELESTNMDNSDSVKSVEVDNYLREVRVDKRATYIERSEDCVKYKINEIFCNSHDLDISDYKQKFDIIFIDGGHGHETIKSDTSKSMEMIKDSGVIVWHDYNSPVFSAVTDYVNSISSKYTIVHILHTQMALLWPKMESALVDAKEDI